LQPGTKMDMWLLPVALWGSIIRCGECVPLFPVRCSAASSGVPSAH